MSAAGSEKLLVLGLTREEWTLYLPAGTGYGKTCSEWPPG